MEDLKCKAAEIVYDNYLNEVYGIESCNFHGYLSLYGLLLSIDLREADKVC